MLRPIQRVCVLTLGILAGCGSLDSIDHVHDLRILGVAADPPDQVLTLGAGPAVTGSIQPVKVTALIADPNGNGRSISYSFAVCAALDTGIGARGGDPTLPSTSSATYRCLPTGYQEFASGSAVATNGWVEVSASFTAPSPLLTSALGLDVYHGLDGLRLPVQITVGADQENIVGTKLVVYTLATSPSYVANENPLVQGLSVDGNAWVDGTPLALSAAAQAHNKGWHVQPVFDPNLEVPYQQPSFTGTLLDFKEIWTFDYFSTFGGFTPTTAGGQNFAAKSPESPDSYWLPDKGSTGPATFWLVARDGRGGESWLVREAVLGP